MPIVGTEIVEPTWLPSFQNTRISPGATQTYLSLTQRTVRLVRLSLTTDRLPSRCVVTEIRVGQEPLFVAPGGVPLIEFQCLRPLAEIAKDWREHRCSFEWNMDKIVPFAWLVAVTIENHGPDPETINGAFFVHQLVKQNIGLADAMKHDPIAELLGAGP